MGYQLYLAFPKMECQLYFAYQAMECPLYAGDNAPACALSGYISSAEDTPYNHPNPDCQF